jgi:DNA invertase Pin-like site-specific DNA recombinase
MTRPPKNRYVAIYTTFKRQFAMEKEAMKAALYMRCSTDMQEMSIPDQRKILREYCHEKGYEIVEEFRDEGISGTTFERRPGAMRIFQKVQAGRHDFFRVVILNESRFGRVPNTKETIHYEYLLEKAGVFVEYAQSESNMPGAPGLIMRAVKYEQAAEFSKQLSRDVIRGLRTAAEKGYSTGGFPPFGYTRMVCDEKGKDLYLLTPGQRKGIKNHWVKWVPGDPRDITLVNRLFTLYSYGNKGIKAICKLLNDEGIPSPKGALWGPDTILSILKNRSYIGERVYGGKWSKKIIDKVTCANAHEPIIARELFDRVQACMKSRVIGRCNGMRTEYLLSGKIVCKSCGYKFQGRKVKNNEGRVYHYYADSGFQNYGICKPLRIPKGSKGNIVGIEDFVILQIENMLDNDRYVERFKEYLKEALIGLERETDTVYPVLTKKLTAINREIEGLIDELLAIKSDALRERLKKREEEREELLREIKKYESIKSQPSKVLLLVNEYAKVLKNVGEILRRRDPGEQKTAIGYFLDRIEVIRAEGVARCYFYDVPRPREIDYILCKLTVSLRNLDSQLEKFYIIHGN